MNGHGHIGQRHEKVDMCIAVGAPEGARGRDPEGGKALCLTECEAHDEMQLFDYDPERQVIVSRATKLCMQLQPEFQRVVLMPCNASQHSQTLVIETLAKPQSRPTVSSSPIVNNPSSPIVDNPSYFIMTPIVPYAWAYAVSGRRSWRGFESGKCFILSSKKK